MRRISSWPRVMAVRSALLIALAYAAFGALWILTTDYLAIQKTLAPDADVTMPWVQTIKGLAYVLITTILVYVLVRGHDYALRRAVEAQEQTELRYRQIVETAGSAIACLDKQLRVREWNPAAERLLAWPREQMLGQDFAERLVPPEQQNAAREFLSRIFEDGQVSSAELPIRTGDERLKTVAWNASLSTWTGAEPEIVVIGEDLTVRRRLEAQLQQSQKLEAIGLLAGGVAHDFNNILTAILGNAEMAREALAKLPADTQGALTDLSQIEHAGNRAANLTRQLLAFSRRSILRLEQVDPVHLLRQIESMLRRLIPESIELRTSVGPHVWRLRADASQLEQVILNLVVNARDAMSNGGTLSIDINNVELDEEYAAANADARPGPYVCLVVSDTGVGMDAETQARIFEPFFTTKPLGEGTGLGLATVHGIVRQLGGHVHVYSESGHGTTFRIYLPAETAEAAPDPAPKREGLPLHGDETILLCEDDASVREMVRLTLESQGYTVLAARNSQEALERTELHGGPLDLLLTDVVLPGMSGPQLADILTQERQALRVLYMSGYTSNQALRHALANESMELLQKPFTPRELLRRVRVVLERSAAASLENAGSR